MKAITYLKSLPGRVINNKLNLTEAVVLAIITMAVLGTITYLLNPSCTKY